MSDGQDRVFSTCDPGTTQIVGYHFTCGACGRRAVRDADADPPEVVASVKRKARCARCGAKGDVEVLWGSAPGDGFVRRMKAHVERENSERFDGEG